MTPAELRADSYASWELACAILHERLRIVRLLRSRAGGAS